MKSFFKIIIFGVVLALVLVQCTKINNEQVEEAEQVEEIIDVTQFYLMTKEEVIEVLGEPERTDARFITFDRGEYKLVFGFYNLRVSGISYYPDEPIHYKEFNQFTEFFPMFGLGDRVDEFSLSWDRDVHAFYDSKNPKDVSFLKFGAVNKERQTIDRIIIGFQEYDLDMKVLEDDYSDVEVVEDIVNYIGTSYEEVFEVWGNPDREGVERWLYTTDIGEILFKFDDNLNVESVYYSFESGKIKFNENAQEVLVMFGIDPKTKGITVKEIITYDDTNRIFFENVYINDKKYEICVIYYEDSNEVIDISFSE